MNKITRENWLNSSLPLLQKGVFGKDYQIPEKVKISCGFPSPGGASLKVIGQCWSPEASSAQNHEIFISPIINDSARVLDILCHELIHAIVGVKEGHKGPFRKCAKAIGLDGKMTATTAGKELTERLNAIKQELGDFPHDTLNPKLSGKKKQGTRMVKLTCNECGYTIRTTAKWIETGTPNCHCGGVFI